MYMYVYIYVYLFVRFGLTMCVPGSLFALSEKPTRLAQDPAHHEPNYIHIALYKDVYTQPAIRIMLRVLEIMGIFAKRTSSSSLVLTPEVLWKQ